MDLAGFRRILHSNLLWNAYQFSFSLCTSQALRYPKPIQGYAEKLTGTYIEETPIRPESTLQAIAVVGAGTMGSGIAQFFLQGGHDVQLLDLSADALEAARSRIRNGLAGTAKRGKITPDEAGDALNRLTTSSSYDALAGADLVIEAVVEKMEVKREVFAALDRVCAPQTILASNTSYLDVDELAQSTNWPERVIGLHFFAPAHIMKLVELVRPARASGAVIDAARQALENLGKVVVPTGVGHGFIGNRMYQCYQREAGLCLLAGAEPEEIDAALTGFGMAMGPLSVMDLSGLDIGYLMRRAQGEGTVHPLAFAVHDQLVEAGFTGRKAGECFYRYDAAGKQISERPAKLAGAIAEKAGVIRRNRTAEEIAERCILALVAEGVAILDEGIADSAADIDRVFVFGFGFPKTLGGPMAWAEARGLAMVRDQVAELAEANGVNWWAQSRALDRGAGSGRWADA